MDKEELSKYMSELGKKGGRANVEKYGREKFSEMGKKGAEKRWGKNEKPEETKES